MSDSSEKKPTTNGKASDTNPFARLSSFKLPRDLTLGSSKATKKIFTPNLNVVRNKNKGAVPNLQTNRRDQEKPRKDRHNAQNKNRNGPNIIKSSGVFSEGLGAAERHSTRSSYSRDTESAPVLTRPTIRVKEVWKIDKELEDQKIQKIYGESQEQDDDDVQVDLKDAPVCLPISEGCTLYSVVKKEKKPVPVKEEIIVKQEPEEDDLTTDGLPITKKHVPEVKAEAYDLPDIVSLLRSDEPKIMLLQLPDNLPGRGAEDDNPQPKQRNAESKEENKAIDNRCKLKDLEEGKIGKILVYKSGKVKMMLGDTLFDLSVSTQSCFRQDVVSVAVNPETNTGSMINLGGIEKKLSLNPDWKTMFKDFVI